MKSENQIIVRCKQSIKTVNPLQCLLQFSHSVGERNVVQTVLSFSFLNALQSDNNSKTVYCLGPGIKIFWALLRALSNPCLTALAEMSLEYG